MGSQKFLVSMRTSCCLMFSSCHPSFPSSSSSSSNKPNHSTHPLHCEAENCAESEEARKSVAPQVSTAKARFDSERLMATTWKKLQWRCLFWALEQYHQWPSRALTQKQFIAYEFMWRKNGRMSQMPTFAEVWNGLPINTYLPTCWTSRNNRVLQPSCVATQGLGQFYTHDAQAAQTDDAYLVTCRSVVNSYGKGDIDMTWF